MQCEKTDCWMVMLLEDIRDVAAREGMGASAEAIGAAIDTLRVEAGESSGDIESRAALKSDAGKVRH